MQIVDAVNSPRIQQLADIYHMMMGREPAESILRAGSHLKHCHVACNKTRAYPGSADKAELVPYFDALHQIGYTGGVSCECGWDPPGDTRTRPEKFARALETLRSL